MATQSIIVYRNPGEQWMWESSFIPTLFVFCLLTWLCCVSIGWVRVKFFGVNKWQSMTYGVLAWGAIISLVATYFININFF